MESGSTYFFRTSASNSSYVVTPVITNKVSILPLIPNKISVYKLSPIIRSEFLLMLCY